MTTIRAIDVAGQGYAINLYDRTVGPLASGVREVDTVRDRHGDGWHGADLTVEGKNGATLAYLTLHPGAMRQLAERLTMLAAFTEARAYGLPGGCLCSAWSHNLYPCPNDSALDYSMCRQCWTPERGQQDLGMGHGESARKESTR